MSVLYDGIGELVTNDPHAGDGSALGVITDAALLVDGATIAWVGPKAAAPDADQRVDWAGRACYPASSTVMRTWFSQAIGPPSSPLG